MTETLPCRFGAKVAVPDPRTDGIRCYCGERVTPCDAGGLCLTGGWVHDPSGNHQCGPLAR